MAKGRGRGRGRGRPRKILVPIYTNTTPPNSEKSPAKNNVDLKVAEDSVIESTGRGANSSDYGVGPSDNTTSVTVTCNTVSLPEMEEGTVTLSTVPSTADVVAQSEKNINLDEHLVPPIVPDVTMQSPHQTLESDTTKEAKDPPKVWANLFQKNRFSSNGMALEYIPPVILDGKPVGQLMKEEMEEEEKKWKSALVIYVFGNGPGFNAMKRFINQQWSHVPKPELYYHEEGYYVAKFLTIEDAKEVMYAGPYTIANRPMILKHWSVDFDFKAEFPNEIPLWVKFPNLPMSCWGIKSLSRIASVLGKPLFADECTTNQSRISFARILIEVNVSKPLPNEIELMDPTGNRFIQDVTYDWKPTYCEKCLQVGHNCLAMPKPQPTNKHKVTQQWRPKVVTENTIQVQASNSQEQTMAPSKQIHHKQMKAPNKATDSNAVVKADNGKQVLPEFNIDNFPPLTPMVLSNRFQSMSEGKPRNHPDKGGPSFTK